MSEHSQSDDGVASNALNECANRMEQLMQSEDAQSAKIREQDNLIKKLYDYIDSLEGCGDSLFRGLTRDEALNRWENVKKEKP